MREKLSKKTFKARVRSKTGSFCYLQWIRQNDRSLAKPGSMKNKIVQIINELYFLKQSLITKRRE